MKNKIIASLVVVWGFLIVFTISLMVIRIVTEPQEIMLWATDPVPCNNCGYK